MPSAADRDIHSLYILKAICALAVVAIHTPMGVLREEVNVLASLAVPLFFAITGYFLYHEDECTLRKKVVRSLGKLMPITLGLHFIYLFLPHGFRALGQSWQYYAKWLLVGMNNNEVHLWYLSALIYALALVCCLRSYSVLVGMLALVLHGFLSAYLTGSWGHIYWTHPLAFAFRYTLATGLGYLSLGMFIRHWRSALLAFPYALYSLLLLIALLYLGHFLKSSSVGRICLAIRPILITCSVITIFTICLQQASRPLKGVWSWIGKHLSADIYYWHILVLWLVSPYIPKAYNVPWVFLVTALLSVLLAWALQHLYGVVGQLIKKEKTN